MFSGVSLSDRLKAAVNQLEATGSSLQQRALTAAQQAQTPPLDRKPSNPPLDRKASNPVNAAKSDDRPQSPRSPPPTGSASHLADSALSGLNELRRSFSSFRNSQEGSRPSSADIEAAGKAQKRSSSPLKKTEAEKAEESNKESKEEGKQGAAKEADAKHSKDKPELLAPEFDLGTPNTSTAVSGQATPAPAEAPEASKTSPPKSPAPETDDEPKAPAPDAQVKEAEAKADVASDAPAIVPDAEAKDTEPASVAEPTTSGGGKKKKKKGKKGGNAGADKAEEPKPIGVAKATEEPTAEPAPIEDDAAASDKPTEGGDAKKEVVEEKPAAKVEDEVPAPVRLPTPTEDDPAKTLADTERRFEGERPVTTDN